MRDFWASLPAPFLVQAPLANVTDAAFRRMIATYSKPQGPAVMYTEFVSADGLMRGNREVLLKDLLFSQAERPIVAQLFTADPLMMEEGARLVQELGFDGVDINMGCPDQSIERQGAGAKLMLTPSRARELVVAAKRGAPLLPVSVKTRLGYTKDSLEEWLPLLLAAAPAAVALHARTRKEMSKVPAHWERVKRAVDIRNALKSPARIIGNGDALDMPDARAKAEESGADGVMLGRALFGRPWLFAEREPSLEERLSIAIEHTNLFEELLGGIKSFAVMKKHFKAYIEGFSGARELRAQLMETENAHEVEQCLKEWKRWRAADVRR